MIITKKLFNEMNRDFTDPNAIGKVYQVNNSVTFSGKPTGSEEFLNQRLRLSVLL